MWSNDNSPTRGYTLEEAHSARRAFLRGGPAALARVIGNPAVAAGMARHLPAPSATDAAGSAWPVRAPLIDVLDEGAELLAVADLPGASVQTVKITLDGNTLCLQARDHGDVYRCALPAAVDASTLRWELRNGILEVRLQKCVP